jgi:hypothetical protein
MTSMPHSGSNGGRTRYEDLCNSTCLLLIDAQVIITSFLFPNGSFSQASLNSTLQALGGLKDKLVIDLSCRKKDNTWFVAMNKWQTITDFEINAGMFGNLNFSVTLGITSNSEYQKTRGILWRVLDSCC